MFRFIVAALLLVAPVQAHPGHENYEVGGECVSINEEKGSPCYITSLGDTFIITDAHYIWTFEQIFDMVFAEYYTVSLNGEYLRDDVCWKSARGIHCRKFSFIYE